ncbi:MAG TPA: type II secretion system F family protein [Verrucomicrobiae bacterium]|nr:type II secretion system F family protein [Verrucomicrobiae bacterium]
MKSAITTMPFFAESGGLIILYLFWMLLKILAATVSFLLSIGIVLGLIFLLHSLFSLPIQRAERARLFLDLLEDALNRGRSIEEMILSIAQSRDPLVGMRFHLLAAYIENGLRFPEALKKVPRFLPPQISSMLLAGEKFGDIKKVLPACREILHERPAGVRSAVHYMLLIVLIFSPVFAGVVTMTTVYVIPKFREVAAGTNAQLSALSVFVFANSFNLIVFAIAVSLLLLLATIIYIGGPDLVRRFQFRKLPIVDWIAWRVPWKQKRLQRTFSAMLAVLLDGGVPEAEAVRLAGDCTANEICRRRAQRAIVALQSGSKLTDAVRVMDDAGEFQWRLTNATHGRGGFLNALRGWHEALDAKAFQQEEATAHVVTSGLVILNGVLVALIATAMFGILIAILNGTLAAT